MYIIAADHHRHHASDSIGPDGLPILGWEVPERAERLRAALLSAGLGRLAAPLDYGLEPILAVHTAGYVGFLQAASAAAESLGPIVPSTFATRPALRCPADIVGQAGYYSFGTGAPLLPGTWQAAYWSAQIALTAAGHVWAGERSGYALCRPPGHHAAADLCGGYCYLNNAAVAVRYLQACGLGEPPAGARDWRSGSSKEEGARISRRGPGESGGRVGAGASCGSEPAGGAGEPRVAVLDVDYHHGNGTQSIFYSDPGVLYCSLHADPDGEYPFYWGGAEEQGEGPGLGANRNWPLPPGTGDDAYLAALGEALASIEQFRPAYLVVSLGLDTVTGDPEGGFDLSAGGIAEAGRLIAGLKLPTVVIQEGGYRLDLLGDLAVAFLRPFG